MFVWGRRKQNISATAFSHPHTPRAEERSSRKKRKRGKHKGTKQGERGKGEEEEEERKNSVGMGKKIKEGKKGDRVCFISLLSCEKAEVGLGVAKYMDGHFG